MYSWEVKKDRRVKYADVHHPEYSGLEFILTSSEITQMFGVPCVHLRCLLPDIEISRRQIQKYVKIPCSKLELLTVPRKVKAKKVDSTSKYGKVVQITSSPVSYVRVGGGLVNHALLYMLTDKGYVLIKSAKSGKITVDFDPNKDSPQ